MENKTPPTKIVHEEIKMVWCTAALQLRTQILLLYIPYYNYNLKCSMRNTQLGRVPEAWTVFIVSF